MTGRKRRTGEMADDRKIEGDKLQREIVRGLVVVIITRLTATLPRETNENYVKGVRHGPRSKCSKIRIRCAGCLERSRERQYARARTNSNHTETKHPVHHGRRHRMDAGRPLP